MFFWWPRSSLQPFIPPPKHSCYSVSSSLLRLFFDDFHGSTAAEANHSIQNRPLIAAAIPPSDVFLTASAIEPNALLGEEREGTSS
ncbi:hypothetical protein LINPERPRIM_LOCUS194 [Linum perenne]